VARITVYKGKSNCVVPTEASLADELIIFYARFKADNSEPSRKTLAPWDDQVLLLSEADMRNSDQLSTLTSSTSPCSI
jgi:hypothetical protein